MNAPTTPTGCPMTDAGIAELDSLRAENARLRAGIESIATIGVTHPHLWTPEAMEAYLVIHPELRTQTKP